MQRSTREVAGRWVSALLEQSQWALDLALLLIPFAPRKNRSAILKPKRGILWNGLALLLRPLVGPRFIDGYWTTIGRTIYHPPGIDPTSVRHRGTMVHEREHVRQFLRWGIWLWVAYLLLLPVGFNPFRAYWEIQAYRYSIRHGFPRERVLDLLSGSAYGWAMPRKWIDRLL